MTNGEKIQTILDIDRDCTEVYGENGTMIFTVTQDFWNAEYKEPITENCIACKYDEIEESDGEHCKKCLAGDSQFELDKEFVQPTTKNDLGIDNQNIRLIDADALIKRLRPKHFDWWGEGEQDNFSKGNNSMLEEVIEAIEEFPSVTPIRPKGHWIWVFDETPSTPNSPYEVNYAGWVCSCCHKFPDDICEWDDPDEPPTYKFCPNCGSDNREVEE